VPKLLFSGPARAISHVCMCVCLASVGFPTPSLPISTSTHALPRLAMHLANWGEYSVILPTKIAVYQALVLSNDIGRSISCSIIKLFADDTNVFIYGKSVEDLQAAAMHEITLLSEWL